MTPEEQNTRESLEAEFGEVLDTDQLQEKYKVVSFAAPLVIVVRKEDGQRGSLMFTHMPRFYFNFLEY